MTVHHYDREVEIVGGDADEGWAVIEYSEKDTGRRDVPVSELRADDKTKEVFGKLIDLDNSLMDYDKHLQSGSLDVRLTHRNVAILTINEERLYEADLYIITHEALDSPDVADEVEEVLHWVQMAYEQPKRLLYNRQDELMEVDA